jgi:uncharacterized protein YerC
VPAQSRNRAQNYFDDEVTFRDERKLNVRYVVAHMIEETGRRAAISTCSGS